MGRFRGKVLYPFVLFSQAKEDVTDVLFRHEMEHVYQVRRKGWFGFYLKYLWLSRKGYKNHPFELAANKRQTDPLTKEEQALKA
jgi:hypothetical protein